VKEAKAKKKPVTKARVVELIQTYLMISYKTIGIIVFIFIPLVLVRKDFKSVKF